MEMSNSPFWFSYLIAHNNSVTRSSHGPRDFLRPKGSRGPFGGRVTRCLHDARVLVLKMILLVLQVIIVVLQVTIVVLTLVLQAVFVVLRILLVLLKMAFSVLLLFLGVYPFVLIALHLPNNLLFNG